MPQLSIDEFISATGWTSDNAIPVLENEIIEFIANENVKSLAVRFDKNEDNFVEKIFGTPIDASGFTELRFWFYSFYRKRPGQYSYKKPEDFSYKIDFGFDEFFIPAVEIFHHITIKLPASASITKVRITALHGDLDSIVFSHLTAVTDELPLDISLGLRTAIVRETEPLAPIPSGTGTGVFGGEELTVTGIELVDRHSQILIGSERHIVADVRYGTTGTTVITFDDQLDGVKLGSNFTDEPVFLELPVQIIRRKLGYIGNAITITTSEATITKQDSEESFLIDTFRVGGTVEVRTIGSTKNIAVQIDCESNHELILQRLQRAAVAFVARVTFWANGIRMEAYQVSANRVEAPSLDVIPKFTIVLAVEFEEDIWPRINQTFPLVGPLTVQVKLKPSP